MSGSNWLVQRRKRLQEWTGTVVDDVLVLIALALFAAPRRRRGAALMRRWRLSRTDLDQAADSLGVRRMTDKEWAEVDRAAPP